MTNAPKKRTLLLVPMKDPEKSKTRLRDSLNLKDRAYLAKSLFKRTLQILKIVANNNIVGKLEKSKGLKAFIATIRINNESKILLVKNTSKSREGKGNTIIATNIKIPSGNPIFLITGVK